MLNIQKAVDVLTLIALVGFIVIIAALTFGCATMPAQAPLQPMEAKLFSKTATLVAIQSLSKDSDQLLKVRSYLEGMREYVETDRASSYEQVINTLAEHVPAPYNTVGLGIISLLTYRVGMPSIPESERLATAKPFILAALDGAIEALDYEIRGKV